MIDDEEGGGSWMVMMEMSRDLVLWIGTHQFIREYAGQISSSSHTSIMVT